MSGFCLRRRDFWALRAIEETHSAAMTFCILARCHNSKTTFSKKISPRIA
jgi:hypothetical protein